MERSAVRTVRESGNIGDCADAASYAIAQI